MGDIGRGVITPVGGDSLGETLVQSMDGNWKSIGDGFAKMLQRMAAEAVAADITRALFGSWAKGGSGEGWLSGLFQSFAGGFGGGRASGGSVTAGTMYRVNENGPELLDVNGRQYLMMGNRGGMVEPAGRGRNTGGGYVQNVNIAVEGHVDRRTAQQIAQDVYLRSRRAYTRSA